MAEQATASEQKVINSTVLFTELMKKLREKPPEVMQRVVAHIRESTGHNTLPAYHNNGATEVEKVAMYKEIIIAVVRNDWERLKGSVAAGQAKAEEQPKPEPKSEPKKAPASYKVGCKQKGDKDWTYNGLRFASMDEGLAYGHDLRSRWMGLDKFEVHESGDDAITAKWDKSEGLIHLDAEGAKKNDNDELVPRTDGRPVAPAPAAQNQNAMAAAIAAAISSALGSMQPQQPAVDEAMVRSLVGSIVNDRMKDLRSEAMTKVDEYIAKLPPRDVIEIRKWDGTVKEIKGKTHKQYKQLLKALSSRNAQGWSEFLYVWGAPGAGKTFLGAQLAEALGVPFHPFPCGPTATEGKMLGFNNIANGTFTAGWLYNAYKNGGLVILDEIDLADGSCMAANNSIENDTFTFGNGEQVKRHKDFYLIAFANTLGTGSTGGFTRNKLDAATLNRFTIIKLEYDETLERDIFGNPKWAAYVSKVREYVEKSCKGSIHVTPRATRKGAAYLANGFTPEEVCDMTLFGLLSEDIKKTIISNVGIFKP